MLRQSIRVALVCFVLLLTFGLGISQAQDFPTKPVTLVVPKSAGGGHDLTARALSSVAKNYLGQPLVVQLKPGGGGAIGADYVANSAADGYTLLFGDPGINSAEPAINNRSKGPGDLEAVCQINFSPFIILVRSDAPYKTMKEMVAWAKENPGKLVFANAGTGGAVELAWKLLMKEAGFTSKIIPYEGGGPSMLAVLGGHADAAMPTSAPAIPQIKAGKMIALAVLTEVRDSDLANVPTAKEQGINVVYPFWKGILAPKGTPRQVVEKLAQAFKKMTDDPTFVSTLKGFGDSVSYMGPERFTKEWQAEFDAHKELAKFLKK